MLGEFSREYEYLSSMGSFLTFNEAESDQETTPRRAAYTSCILQTKWGQREPYNNKCNGNAAGCVAVAMDQIMYYHKYPSSYNWENMLKSYSSNYTTTQANAVATLIKDCGEAVHMNYGVDASSALANTAWAFVHIFGYNENIKYYKRDYFTQSDWESIILSELKNERPIQYSGTGNDGAHSFVLDGYDGNGYYHINWGWNGSGTNPNYSNKSYFKLSSLKPKVGNTTRDYTYNQDMVCFISKDVVGHIGHLWVADRFQIGNGSTTFNVGSQATFKLTNLWCQCTEANPYNYSTTCTCRIAVWAKKEGSNSYTCLSNYINASGVKYNYGWSKYEGTLTFKSDKF